MVKKGHHNLGLPDMQKYCDFYEVVSIYALYKQYDKFSNVFYGVWTDV